MLLNFIKVFYKTYISKLKQNLQNHVKVDQNLQYYIKIDPSFHINVKVEYCNFT